MASAGAGTIGTELKAELHLAASTDAAETSVGLIRREALLTLTTLNHMQHISNVDNNYERFRFGI